MDEKTKAEVAFWVALIGGFIGAIGGISGIVAVVAAYYQRREAKAAEEGNRIANDALEESRTATNEAVAAADRANRISATALSENRKANSISKEALAEAKRSSQAAESANRISTDAVEVARHALAFEKDKASVKLTTTCRYSPVDCTLSILIFNQSEFALNVFGLVGTGKGLQQSETIDIDGRFVSCGLPFTIPEHSYVDISIKGKDLADSLKVPAKRFGWIQLWLAEEKTCREINSGCTSLFFEQIEAIQTEAVERLRDQQSYLDAFSKGAPTDLPLPPMLQALADEREAELREIEFEVIEPEDDDDSDNPAGKG